MQKSHLQRHTATHTGERKHVCPICNKTFIEPGDVRKHMRTHTKESINYQLINSNGTSFHQDHGDIDDIKPQGLPWIESQSSQHLNQSASQIIGPTQVVQYVGNLDRIELCLYLLSHFFFF